LSFSGLSFSGLKLAKAANIPLEIEFYWREKPTAAHPGT
jgi:hypothetical protein